MTAEACAVELRDVTRRFDNFLALDGVSLQVLQGEFFGILGPSGCGKSTMLRLIAGLDQPDSGTVLIDGADMRGVPPHRRPCNMVFQSYAIFPHLNIRDNVAYGLRQYGLTKAEKFRRVDDMLTAVRLEGFGERKPEQLSGGQRQRVALARALVRRPKVLLLDEPLGALDKTLREQMQMELRDLQKSVGITFIFVTHDQEEALSMSDRIAVMSQGRLLQVAAPVDLYERPNCRTVASFIGDMNFLDATTSEVAPSGTPTVRIAGLGQVEFPQLLDGEQPGYAHKVAMRPEKLRVSRERTDADICVPGRVVSSAYWGDQSQFQVMVEGCNDPLAVAAHNVDPSGGGRPLVGDEIWLSLSARALLRFHE